MKKVIWSPIGRESLIETVDFIMMVWDDNIVSEFLDLLDYRIQQIQQNPELAPVFKDNKFRQLFVHKTISLFYVNYPEYLKILLVWDNRQDPSDLLAKLQDSEKL